MRKTLVKTVAKTENTAT